MPIKNRLDELKAAQAEADQESGDPYAASYEEVQLTIDTEPKDEAMAAFFVEVESIRDLIVTIRTDVEASKKIQSTLLSAPTTNEKLSAQLEDLAANIKRTGNTVRAALKKIDREMEGDVDPESDCGRLLAPRTAADVRIRKTQHFTLTREFIEVMTEYNAAQTDYRERVKSKLKRQLEITGRNTTDDELEDMIAGGDPAIFTSGINTQEDTRMAKQTLADIQHRHEDIIKLEKSIKELHDMFVDMAMLIESQGQMIDRIEHHVDNAVEYVEKATGDMKKALEYQSAARRKKIMIGLISTAVSILVGAYVANYLGLM